MSRKDEVVGDSFDRARAKAARGRDRVEAARPRLSQQQKDWIRETIKRLKAASGVVASRAE